MKLPESFSSTLLEARQNDGADTGDGESCDCLGGGAIAGIVIGSIAGAFLLYWLIKFAYDSRSTAETTVTRYDRPQRRQRSRRSSYYDESPPPPPVARRRRHSRRDTVEVERPPKVYLNGTY